MQQLYEPVLTHEVRYWYSVFNDRNLRRAVKAPKDGRPAIMETREFVEDSTFAHIFIATHSSDRRTITTYNSQERLTAIPILVAEMLDCADQVARVDIDGREVPVYREWYN